MSEVNADGVLINPKEALLQEAQYLPPNLLAPKVEDAPHVSVQKCQKKGRKNRSSN